MRWYNWITVAGAVAATPACSLKKMTVDQTATVLKDGGRVFDEETDPELARQALPSSLKTMESFLAVSPDNAVLLEMLARGYMSYAFGFVDDERERVQEMDPERAERLRRRSLDFYLRARGYGLRLLAQEHEQLAAVLRQGTMPDEALLAALTAEDVPALFWTANPWVAAIDAGKDQPELVAQLSVAKRLLERCVALDEQYFHAGPHMALGAIEGALPMALGGRPDVAQAHFERVFELTEGHHLMAKVLLAKTVAVQRGERAEFVELLHDVISADAAAYPALALANRLAQVRAQRYLAEVDVLFLE